MILRILGILLLVTLLLFIGYWIWNGGFFKGLNFSSGLDNPFNLYSTTTSGGTLRLPGQPGSLIDTIDISEYAEANPNLINDGLPTEDQLNALKNRYQELSLAAKDPKNFGNPSPYRDQVIFGLHDAHASIPTSEYLTLQANFGNSAPITLSGWSLQSAVTGVRMTLPQAAPEFVSGVLNNVSDVTLSPGTSAYIISGPSPVGVSFRENICSGYLGELQKFTPELALQCPLASDDISLNAENISRYGDACIDYAKNLPQCHFPGLDKKPNVTDACATFLLNHFSYNGCVYTHRNDANFYGASWRLYLASAVNLWRDTHDVIRLLDSEGRTVDVLTY